MSPQSAKRSPGIVPHTYWTIDSSGTHPVDGGIIEESLLSIYVNGQELATIMCSPLDHESLAVGFLYNEGVIDDIAEIARLQLNAAESTIDVLLTRSEFSPPQQTILTSGCGRGIALQGPSPDYPAVESDLVTTPAVLQARMRDLSAATELYRAVRGVHGAVLASTTETLVSVEDIGRHNTIDKLAGRALLKKIATNGNMILTTGRISSEMLRKARRLGVPLIASRTSPTSAAVALAQAWRISIIGYVRRDSLRVYTHPFRLGVPETPGVASRLP